MIEPRWVQPFLANNVNLLIALLTALGRQSGSQRPDILPPCDHSGGYRKSINPSPGSERIQGFRVERQVAFRGAGQSAPLNHPS